jgi:tellurite resistance protein TehA-like permease
MPPTWLSLGWALTFPNVGWISTIRVLADIFHLEGFYIWHTIMATLMASTWVVLIILTAMAFWKGKIFMAKPEDVLKDARKGLFDDEKQPRTNGSDHV